MKIGATRVYNDVKLAVHAGADVVVLVRDLGRSLQRVLDARRQIDAGTPRSEVVAHRWS